jgi:hypothetical protein
VSGFTRDSHHYGERLVYEALTSKWDRCHVRCGCGRDWVTAHAEPAGFSVVRSGSGFVALVGPGLTEDVDEDQLTTNALWQAVTGTEGDQGWFEQVRVVERPALSPEEQEQGKAANRVKHAEQRERTAKAKTELLTSPQLNYLRTLASKVSRERFDEDFARAIKGSTVAPRSADEKTQQVIERLTKDAARKLITALKGSR